MNPWSIHPWSQTGYHHGQGVDRAFILTAVQILRASSSPDWLRIVRCNNLVSEQFRSQGSCILLNRSGQSATSNIIEATMEQFLLIWAYKHFISVQIWVGEEASYLMAHKHNRSDQIWIWEVATHREGNCNLNLFMFSSQLSRVTGEFLIENCHTRRDYINL